MKVEISNIEQFKNFFDVIFDVASDTIELKFFMDKMTCAILDKGHTRFFYVEYESKFFDVYDVDEIKSVLMSIVDIYNLVKLANKTDILILEFFDDTISAQLLNGENKRVFEFAYASDYVESPNFPQIQLPVQMTLDVKDMAQSVKDIGIVGTDIFQFVVSENNVTLMSDASSSTYSASTTKYAQIIETDVDISDVMSVKFSLNFIKQMLDFKKISKEVEMELGGNALVYKFEDEIMGVTVRGLIAPRIEED